MYKRIKGCVRGRYPYVQVYGTDDEIKQVSRLNIIMRDMHFLESVKFMK